jgi:ribosome-associated protein
MILIAMNNKTPKAIKGYWSNGRFVKPEEIAL